MDELDKAAAGSGLGIIHSKLLKYFSGTEPLSRIGSQFLKSGHHMKHLVVIVPSIFTGHGKITP